LNETKIAQDEKNYEMMEWSTIVFNTNKLLTWENGSLALSNDNIMGQNEDLHYWDVKNSKHNLII
jgi:hypothetical protein